MPSKRKTQSRGDVVCVPLFLPIGRRKAKKNPGKPVFVPLTPREKRIARKTVAEMIEEWKKGRWVSKKQAIAVGLSKARRA